MVNSLESVIKEHPFFHEFPKDQLKLITSCAKNVEFPQGHFIVLEGDSANEFYFIRKGSVSIELNIPERGPTTMQTIGEGEILGWSWVSPPYLWHFNAKDPGAYKSAGVRRKMFAGKMRRKSRSGLRDAEAFRKSDHRSFGRDSSPATGYLQVG